jgi:hypothetical protein
LVVSCHHCTAFADPLCYVPVSRFLPAHFIPSALSHYAGLPRPSDSPHLVWAPAWHTRIRREFRSVYSWAAEMIGDAEFSVEGRTALRRLAILSKCAPAEFFASMGIT